jgi:hypothetical protein
MSCDTPPCWSVNAELSGERRKEVNVSGVMMRVVGAGAGAGRCGEEGERGGDDEA